MRVHRTTVDDALVFAPAPGAGFDTAIARCPGLAPVSGAGRACSVTAVRGTVHGLHRHDGTLLVRCADGAAYVVVVDARPRSRTFGRIATSLLDAGERRRLLVPAGCLYGFQALTDVVELRHRGDTSPAARAGTTVRSDDPDLAVRWPIPPDASVRDRAAVRWADLCGRLGVEVPERSCAMGW